MSNILIIGNSLAAVAAIEEIRRSDKESSITLFCPEGVLPYNRALLPAILAKDAKESHAHVVHEKFFKEHNVKLVHNEVLTRISIKRNQVTTESKAHFSFDKLLMTDLPGVRLPSVKGHQKTGVFDVFRLTSLKEIIKEVPYVESIVVPVTNFAGFEFACALSRLGKSVILLCPPQGILAEIFDDDTAALLKQIVEAKNIRVIGDSIEEILGDAEVKAVKLKSGKVIAAEMVLFDQIQPDVRVLSESGLLEEDQIVVGEFFNTLAENIFACDCALGAYDLLHQESIAQGTCAAANMMTLGSKVFEPPVLLRDFGTKVVDGFCGGFVRLLEGGREKMQFDGPSNIYKKVYLLNDALVGAVWFNALADKPAVLKALLEKSLLLPS